VQRFFEQVIADFANMVLHHAEGPGHMFREMARVVKPGGARVAILAPLGVIQDRCLDQCSIRSRRFYS
jgi:ubiquinone/menaquinone biosynthesis C-methylase UbiE